LPSAHRCASLQLVFAGNWGPTGRKPFRKVNPTKQALLHRRSKRRDRVRSLIVSAPPPTLAGNATSVVCQAPPVEAPVEPQCQRSPLGMLSPSTRSGVLGTRWHSPGSGECKNLNAVPELYRKATDRNRQTSTSNEMRFLDPQCSEMTDTPMILEIGNVSQSH
jgi:hypothetical protein